MTRTYRSIPVRSGTTRLVWAAGAVVFNVWSVPAAFAETRQPTTGSVTAASALAAQRATAPSAPQPVTAQPDVWSPAEIAAGIAQCSQMLAGKDIVAIPVPAFKDGDCGSPAAIQLVSVGRNPEVMINPPITVTCEIASTLATWVRTDLQPLAKAHLGTNIVRIDTMSSYSCRNAYGRKKSRLSEHGRANAIDIRAFLTKSNDEAAVLVDWGMNERRQAVIVAAARAAEARRVAIAAADARVSAARKAQSATTTTASIVPPPSAAGTTDAVRSAGTGTRTETPRAQPPALAFNGSDAASIERDSGLPLPRLGTLIEGLPNLGARIPTLSRPALNGSGFGEPYRLGGPKPQPVVAPAHAPGDTPSRKEAFLRAVHASACRTFGTVLGPEANAAHENHFHFDMADRGGKHFCE